jgi:beta-galactosidase
MKEPPQSSYFGIVDLAGLPKDRYYLYQSKWSDKPVFCASTLDLAGTSQPKVPVFVIPIIKAELFVNG